MFYEDVNENKASFHFYKKYIKTVEEDNENLLSPLSSWGRFPNS
jgi:hypothetical protein